MKIEKYIQGLLFILIAVYFAQGSLYAKGSVISRTSLFLLLIISVYYLVITLLSRFNKSSFYKAWTSLLLLNVLGFLFSGDLSSTLHFEMFKNVLMTFLLFYPFYYFANLGVLKSKNLVCFLMIMIPVFVLSYYYSEEELLLSGKVVNNTSYYFVSLIPFVFLIKRNQLLSFISMLVLMFFIIQGSKRGALISGSIGTLFFLYYKLRMVPKKNRIRAYLVIILALIGIVYYAYHVYITNEYLVRRINSMSIDNSSGRNTIYTSVFNSWLNTDSIINLLFGFGFASSLSLSGSGHYAHNDWLELLSNFGLLGVFIYGSLFYFSIKSMKSKEWMIDKRIVLLTVISIWIFTSLISMSYTSINGCLQSVLLAYLLGSRNKSLV